MNYTAEIKVYGDAEKLARCFEPELGKKEGRSEFAVKKHKDHIAFEVLAADSVALRATLNSIAKLLAVYENIAKI
jgi:tRNA threonylcarbamoyladenosine modification (KEOPS) complex  Pcc1 subunit